MCLFVLVLYGDMILCFGFGFCVIKCDSCNFYVKISKDLSIIQAIIIEFVLMLLITNFIDNYTLKKSILFHWLYVFIYFNIYFLLYL